MVVVPWRDCNWGSGHLKSVYSHLRRVTVCAGGWCWFCSFSMPGGYLRCALCKSHVIIQTSTDFFLVKELNVGQLIIIFSCIEIIHISIDATTVYVCCFIGCIFNEKSLWGWGL